ELFDRIVIVDCLPEQQIKRVTQRDELDVVTIKSIIKTQVSRETRLIAATDVLDNSGNINTLKDQVENLHKDFLTL
ncbi:MAG TPA: dephospho-CoA kinase, partial [Leucothrix sp.]|nr:dephospho-CoA kinase [Leucothrix sp.]